MARVSLLRRLEALEAAAQTEAEEVPEWVKRYAAALASDPEWQEFSALLPAEEGRSRGLPVITRTLRERLDTPEKVEAAIRLADVVFRLDSLYSEVGG